MRNWIDYVTQIVYSHIAFVSETANYIRQSEVSVYCNRSQRYSVVRLMTRTARLDLCCPGLNPGNYPKRGGR